MAIIQTPPHKTGIDRDMLEDRAMVGAGLKVRYLANPYGITKALAERRAEPMDLGEALGVPTATVRRWLDYDRPTSITLQMAQRVADALNGAVKTARGALVLPPWGIDHRTVMVEQVIDGLWRER